MCCFIKQCWEPPKSWFARGNLSNFWEISVSAEEGPSYHQCLQFITSLSDAVGRRGGISHQLCFLSFVSSSVWAWALQGPSLADNCPLLESGEAFALAFDFVQCQMGTERLSPLSGGPSFQRISRWDRLIAVVKSCALSTWCWIMEGAPFLEERKAISPHWHRLPQALFTVF